MALGADSVVNVTTANAEVETQKLTGGGLDVVVETAGAAAAAELATRLAREGGRVVLLGIAGQGEELTMRADRVALRDLTVYGSVGYTTVAWRRGWSACSATSSSISSPSSLTGSRSSGSRTHSR